MERQELWCHECDKYVQFDIDTELNGNHVIICPDCGHEHCRVVKNGVITNVRWDSRNIDMQAFTTYMTTGMTTSNVSTYNTYTSNQGTTIASTQYVYNAWMNLSGGS